jgi:hypothetical protein
MIRRLHAWWHRRQRREACETCGVSLRPKDAHHVTSAFAVDSWEIGGGGGASITATFCAEHCPGGCERERVDA